MASLKIRFDLKFDSEFNGVACVSMPLVLVLKVCNHQETVEVQGIQVNNDIRGFYRNSEE